MAVLSCRPDRQVAPANRRGQRTRPTGEFVSGHSLHGTDGAVGSNVLFRRAQPSSLAGQLSRGWPSIAGAPIFDLDSDHPVSRYEAWSNIAAARRRRTPRGVGSLSPGCGARIPAIAGARLSNSAAGRQITASSKSNYDRLPPSKSTCSRTSATRCSFRELRRATRWRSFCSFASWDTANILPLRWPSCCALWPFRRAWSTAFESSEFNDLTSQYVVRDSDAHSWVEAYFQGYGWVSFDPTPGGPAPAQTGLGPDDALCGCDGVVLARAGS